MTDSIFSVRPLQKLFDLDADLSIPAWFSSVQLLSVSALLFLIAKQRAKLHQLPPLFFTLTGFLFLFLALDEGVGIHEKVTILAIKLSFDWMMFQGNHGAWIMGYTLFALPLLWVATPYVRKIWQNYRFEAQLAISGGLVFVVGAVGFEIISYLFLRAEADSILYQTEVLFEEFFEMCGVSIILYAALQFAYNISTDSVKNVRQVHAETSS